MKYYLLPLLCLLGSIAPFNLTSQTKSQQSNLDESCSRMAKSSVQQLANLVIGDLYSLEFYHNGDIGNTQDFFDPQDVEKSYMENGLLYFTPLKERISFIHPGYKCDQKIINNHEFNIKNITQANSGFVPLTLVDGDSPTTLVETVLLGDVCLDVENAVAPGGTAAYGQFFDGQSTVGIETGVILATGSIFTATGPNNAAGSSSSVGTAGFDQDLSDLNGATSLNDVAILEFDFVPDQDSISFDYVFASEEYCDFVGSAFNDVFGFFLSGPGINGPYSNNAENIALIPGTTTPVSINNVNYTTNGEFYNTNVIYEGVGGGCTQAEIDEPDLYQKDIEYDGFTTILQAKAAVIPCETYHIKLAIADVGDGAWDSAVFLGKNSFVSGDAGVEVTTEIGYTDPVDEAAVEGCSGAYIAFWKNLFLDEVVVYLNIDNSSTATEGVDYAELPDSFVLNIGLNRDTLWLDIFEDLLEEGIETIDISLGGLCACADPNVTINLKDPDPLSITPLEDQGFCDPQNAIFTADVTGGNEPYTYEWSNGSMANTTSVFVDNSGFYYVTVSDDCTQIAYDTVFVEIYPNYEFSEVVEICEGEFYFVGGANQSLPGVYQDNFPTIHDCDSIRNTQLIVKPKAYYDTLIYSCANEPVVIGGQTINFPGVSDVVLSGLAANGCDSIITVEVQWLTPVSSIADPDTLNCLTDSVQLLTIVPNVGQGFEFIWEGPNDFTSNEEHPWVTDPGVYSLTVTQTVNGVFCESFFPFSNEVPIDTLAPDIEPLADITISCGLTEIEIDPNILNQDEIVSADFLWTGPNAFMSENEIITVSDSGSYELLVTNISSGCTEMISVHVSIDNVEPEITSSGGFLGCNADSIQIFSDVNLINGNFAWTGPNGYSASDQNPYVYESGTYYVAYQITPDCIAFDTVEVGVDNTVPEISAIGDTIICNQGDGTLIASSSTIGVTYLWTGPNGFQSEQAQISVLDEGEYTVIITGTNGCESQETVQLTLLDIIPEISVFDDKIDCGELGVNLMSETSGNDLSFTWEGPNGFMSMEESPLVNEPGAYTLFVSNAEGCTNSASLTIEADTLIPEVSVNASTINCYNLTPTIDVFDVVEDLDYSWEGPNSFTGNTEDVEVNTPGTYTLTITSAANGCQNEYSIPISIDTIHPIFSSFGDTLDCNAGTALLSSDVSGSEFDIRWYDEDNNLVGLNAIETVGSEGVYTIIVQNENNGCETSQAVEIFKNEDVPDLSAAGDTINCLATSFSISSSSNTAGVSYAWEGPNSFVSDLNTVEVTDPGTYNITITAPNGCIAIESVEVILDNAEPVVILENDELNCYNPALDLSINATGDGNIYQWEGPNGFESNEESPSILEEGMYSVTVTSSNGCSQMASLSISQDFTEPSIDLGSSNDLDCNFEESLISLITTAPDGSTFNWTGPNAYTSDQQNITISEPGTYEIVITGVNGCENTDQITISQDIEPIALSTNDDFIDCYNDVKQLDINYSSNDIFEINWTGPNNFNSVQLNPLVEEGGTYIVEVTGNNGCTSTASIEIESRIYYPEADLIGDDLSCTNEVVELSTDLNSNDFNYVWDDSNDVNISNTEIAQVTDAGYYFITITDPYNGCSYIDSIEVLQLPDLISYDYNIDNPNCMINFGTISISNIQGGTGPFSYSIDGGNNFSQNTIFDQLDGGTYEIVIQDANGCELENSVEIIALEQFEISAQDQYVLVLGNTEQFEVMTSIPEDEIDSIYWTPADNLSCSDCLNPIVTAITDQVYTVTLIDKNGCELVTTINLRVAENPIYVPNVFTPNGDGQNDYFSIFGNFNTIERINTFQIYDRWGNNVFRTDDVDPKVEEIKWDGTFSNRAVKQDVFAYYIKYTSIDGTEKVLIGDVSVMK